MNTQKNIWKYALIIILYLSVNRCISQEYIISHEIKKEIKEFITNGKSVGIVAGIVNSKGEKEFYCHGFQSQQNNIPVDKNTIYEIGSISKVFTCIAFADMVIKHEVDLEASVSSLLPENVTMPLKNKKYITLKHLANHTSGLPRLPDNFFPTNKNNPYADYTIKQLYTFLNTHTLQNKIGKKYLYSNLYKLGTVSNIILF